MKKIKETEALRKAKKLVVKLTVMFAKEMHDRSKNIEHNRQEEQLRNSQCTSILGRYMTILYRLSKELEILSNRRKETDVDKHVKTLLLFFLEDDREQWKLRTPLSNSLDHFVNIESEFRNIFGKGYKKQKMVSMEDRNREHEINSTPLASLKIPPMALNELADHEIATVRHFKARTLHELQLIKRCGTLTLRNIKKQIEALGVPLDHWIE